MPDIELKINQQLVLKFAPSNQKRFMTFRVPGSWAVPYITTGIYDQWVTSKGVTIRAIIYPEQQILRIRNINNYTHSGDVIKIVEDGIEILSYEITE